MLNYIEGGNEEDDSYPQSLGNTLAVTAQFQQQVYAMGQQDGLPVINMSFGAGWTAANNWEGDYRYGRQPVRLRQLRERPHLSERRPDAAVRRSSN